MTQTASAWIGDYRKVVLKTVISTNNLQAFPRRKMGKKYISILKSLLILFFLSLFLCLFFLPYSFLHMHFHWGYFFTVVLLAMPKSRSVSGTGYMPRGTTRKQDLGSHQCIRHFFQVYGGKNNTRDQRSSGTVIKVIQIPFENWAMHSPDKKKYWISDLVVCPGRGTAFWSSCLMLSFFVV